MTGKIVRSKEPEAQEFPFADLTACTPSDLFYVRNHFPTPEINAANWRLAVEGTVQNVLELSYSDLMAMSSHTVMMTMECAGNSRTFLSPAVPGIQWDMGGISTANFTGVSLVDVLERAGLKPETVEVMFEGADLGNVHEGPHPKEPIHFARSLSLDKARDRDVILAHSMNGEPLTPSHGFPFRLIVPGWYAVASVKWLKRIVAIDHKFNGYFQSIDYAYWDDREGQPQRKPITEMLVKAQIAGPRAGEKIKKGSACAVRGAAWSGAGRITSIEVSTTGGAYWEPAKITSETKAGLWCLFEYDWSVPDQPGEHVLMARASDEKGNVQGTCHDPNRETYMINFCLPVRVVAE